MRRSQRHELRLLTELSLTPVFGLFAILFLVFLLVVPLTRESAAQSGNGKTAPAITFAVITVDKVGALALEGRPITRNALKHELDCLMRDRPGTAIMAQIDRALPSEQLVDLMGILHHAGVQKIAVTTTEN